jgi:transcriptional regulator
MAKGSLDVMKGTLEMLVLTTLSGGGAWHGFAILDWIASVTEGSLEIEEGALYPALHRMEKRGWITGDWGVSDKGRRAKYYSLTRKGKAALARQEDHWARYADAVAKVSAAAGA